MWAFCYKVYKQAKVTDASDRREKVTAAFNRLAKATLSGE